MNDNTEIFENVPCYLGKVLIEQDIFYVIGLIIEDKEYGVYLLSYDAIMFSFADSGCAEASHIKTIHQIYLEHMKSLGFTLESVHIEAKHGDVYYCRLCWAHEKRPIYNVVSIGDALILQSLSQCEMYILRNVISQLELIDSEGYMGEHNDEF